MSAIYDSSHTIIITDGTTDLSLVQGEPYAIGIGGTFASSSLTLAFIDASGNSIPVPALNSIDGATNPLTATAAAVFELVALTNTLRVTASNPNAAAVAISGIASTATEFTVTTGAAHTLAAGDKVLIAGCTVTAYNGTWTVLSSADNTHFVVTSALNPGVASDGTARERLAATIGVTATRIDVVK